MAHGDWNNEKKAKVRNTVIQHFRKLTGQRSIDADRVCLALCGKQANEQDYQIHQYISSGLIRPGQYVGVDRSREVIDFNRQQHPLEKFEHGEWSRVFGKLMNLRPQIIDIDTTSIATTQKAIEWVALAMRVAEPDTLVSFNVGLQHFYRKSSPISSPSDVMESISRRVPPSTLRAWSQETGTFPSRTRLARMQTFLFYRPSLTEVSLAA